MNSHIKRHLSEIECVILAVLRDHGPLHGYDIGVQLEHRLGREIGPGSYYRVLHRLKHDGHLSAFWESEEDAASHQGPRRRYYRLEASPEVVQQLIEPLLRSARQTIAALQPQERTHSEEQVNYQRSA